MMVIVSGTVAIDRDGERVNTLGAGDFLVRSRWSTTGRAPPP